MNKKIKGKELLLRTLNMRESTVFHGCLFAEFMRENLKDIPALEVLKDEEKLFESLLEVNKVYDPTASRLYLIYKSKRKY